MVDVELYGGRRGYLRHIRARALYALGAYRCSGNIDWGTVQRLAFVCKGNICRSPYACAKARSLGVQAVSFGLDAADGACATPAALANARVRGIDLSAHRSTRMQSVHLRDRNLVIVFEPEQVTAVRRHIGDSTPAVLLGIWSRPAVPHIQDPYGLSDRYFQQCFSIIDESIGMLVEYMVRRGVPAVEGRAGKVADETTISKRPSDRMIG